MRTAPDVQGKVCGGKVAAIPPPFLCYNELQFSIRCYSIQEIYYNMGGCQNYGPFLGVPIIIRHLMFRAPKKGP